MNVYVRELVAALAQAGVSCDVYVRAWADDLPAEVDVESGFRVVHVPAGPPDLPKERLVDIVAEFTKGVHRHIEEEGATDAIHANYWLSGVVGHALKHQLDIPLVCTFHTLARVKADTGDDEPAHRVEAESEVIRCSDAILANSEAEGRQLDRVLRRRPRARRDRAARGRPRVLLAGRPARGACRPGPRRRPARAALRRPDPAAQGPRRRHRHPRRAGAPGPASRRRGRPVRPRGRGARGPLPPAGRRGGPRRPGRLPAPPAAPPALELLPRRRRLPGAEPLGVLRAGGAGGGGLRHPGRGGGGGRPDHPRRPRTHRPAGRGAGAGRLRRGRRRAARRPGPRRRHERRRPPPRPGATPGR